MCCFFPSMSVRCSFWNIWLNDLIWSHFSSDRSVGREVAVWVIMTSILNFKCQYNLDCVPFSICASSCDHLYCLSSWPPKLLKVVTSYQEWVNENGNSRKKIWISLLKHGAVVPQKLCVLTCAAPFVFLLFSPNILYDATYTKVVILLILSFPFFNIVIFFFIISTAKN